GVVVATGPEKVFWSQCNVKAGDRFSKKKGKEIALGRSRSEKWLNDQPTYPALIDNKDLVMQEVDFMYDRSKRYYKEE
nr:hypothetical protein [archaeon]